jgi:hypothetical protein
MTYFFRNLFIFLIIIFESISQVNAQTEPRRDSTEKDESQNWYLHKLNFPIEKINNAQPVKVAIIDDGFRLTHKAIRNFIYRNSKEIPNNFRDDDKNGFIDDIAGWDFADKDNDVSVFKSREEDFYHGTYLASIVVKIFQKYFGTEAEKYLQIIPVKTVSDNSKNMLITNGYDGIKYADSLGADIILCAWSGGEFKEENRNIIEKIVQKKKLIIASAGNFYTEAIQPPASIEGVISVAALDSNNRKQDKSNFGMKVDFSAPGNDIFGAHPKADNAFFYESGTSPASAVIAGITAILKSLFPKFPNEIIIEALKYTAFSLDSANLPYAGKLGAGLPDLSNSINYLENAQFKYQYFNKKLTQGQISYNSKFSPNRYEISPDGDFLGIHIIPIEFNERAQIKISSRDSVIYNNKISKDIPGFFVKGNYAKIEIQNPTQTKKIKFDYYVQTIDSTILYCKETNYINQTEGEIEDGSGNENYSNNSSCKWLLTVPEHKRIKIEFTEMNTEPNVDFVWIFDGESTLPENILAKFSGANQPPVITTPGNQVLIWFLTDKFNTGKGWKMKFKAVD